MTIIQQLKGIARALLERVESERKHRERVSYDRALKWRQLMVHCDARDYAEMLAHERDRALNLPRTFRDQKRASPWRVNL